MSRDQSSVSANICLIQFTECCYIFVTKASFNILINHYGAIQVLRNASFPRTKRYECVRFNVISVMRGVGGGQIPWKKRYVTLEWPLCE